MLRTLSFHIELFVAGFFLWLGLYILTRGLPTADLLNRKWQTVRSATFAAGAGVALVSVFFFGVALRLTTLDVGDYIFWLRLTWWTAPVAVALWVRAVFRLPIHPEQEPIFQAHWVYRYVPYVVLAYACLLGALGAFTNTLFEFGAIFERETPFAHLFVPLAWPQHYFYLGYLLLAMWTAVLVYWQRYKQTPAQSVQRREFRWLVWGSAVSACGAMFSLVGYTNWGGQVPEQFGHLLLTIGLGLVGRSVAVYNAFLQERQIAHDFRRSLWRMIINVVAFLAIFHTVHWLADERLAPLTIVLIVFLLILTSAARPWFLWSLNQVTLPSWESRFLFQFSQVREEIMTAPDQHEALGMAQQALISITETAQVEQVREMIGDEIQAIFRHKQFYKDAVMANSGLLNLRLLKRPLIHFSQTNNLNPLALTDGEKARLLQAFLEEYLRTRFCPTPDAPPPSPPSDQWLQYALLLKGYIEGKTRQEVIREVQSESGVQLASGARTGGRVYAQHLQNGRLALAELMWQDELQLRTNQGVEVLR